jgi:hypothetical protein
MNEAKTLISLYRSPDGQYFHFIENRKDGRIPSVVPEYDQSKFNSLPNGTVRVDTLITSECPHKSNETFNEMGSTSLNRKKLPKKQ